MSALEAIHPRIALALAAAVACLSALAGLLLVNQFWGFTVDDAWIVSRVAENGHHTGEFAFNPGSPTDAVTPLGFAQLIALLMRSLSLNSAFETARSLGSVCLVLAFGALGARFGVQWCAQAQSRRQLWAVAFFLCLMLSAVPSGAWAVSGLETGVVTLVVALAYVALLSDSGGGFQNTVGAVLLGLAGAWRHELIPFGLASLWAVHGRARLFLTFSCPVLIVGGLRLLWFSSPLPLSFLAKTPHFSDGVRYALGGAVLSGPLWAIWLGPWKTHARRLAPFLVHVAAVAFAGGDWMALFRLYGPILPAAALVGALGIHRHRAMLAAGFLSVGGACVLTVFTAQNVNSLAERRLQLIDEAKPHLAGLNQIAGVDVGWIGAASPSTSVDLSGVTSPRAARLAGGHTSRLVTSAYLSSREVDGWVVRARDRNYKLSDPPSELQAAYIVDARLLSKFENLGLTPHALIPLQGTREQYVVFRQPKLD